MNKYILIFLLVAGNSLFASNNSEQVQYIKSEFSDSVSILSDAIQPESARIAFLNYSIAGTYGVSMYWLYTQWYKDYPTSSFHFFNDNKEWYQMDKLAHTWDAYIISKALSKSYRWAGYNHKKSIAYGTAITFLYQTTIETFDGFSREWGFSATDFTANVFGLGIFAFQELQWKEQRITLKLSFHQTKYAQYRPQLLGKNLIENIVKDYNGMTNWICINPKSFLKKSNLPSWLSLAIGFGAEGMTGGKFNPAQVNGEAIPDFIRYRQIYLSFDIELSKIKTKSVFWNSVFKLINAVHLPAPAIEFRQGGRTQFKAFYF